MPPREMKRKYPSVTITAKRSRRSDRVISKPKPRARRRRKVGRRGGHATATRTYYRSLEVLLAPSVDDLKGVFNMKDTLADYMTPTAVSTMSRVFDQYRHIRTKVEVVVYGVGLSSAPMQAQIDRCELTPAYDGDTITMSWEEIMTRPNISHVNMKRGRTLIMDLKPQPIDSPSSAIEQAEVKPKDTWFNTQTVGLIPAMTNEYIGCHVAFTNYGSAAIFSGTGVPKLQVHLTTTVQYKGFKM